MYDVIIVGGGPAGMSAALVLGRCRRSVLICDTGKPRNRWARAMNGYLTRDGVSPAEFLEAARKDVEKYDVNWLHEEVSNARFVENGFALTTAAGKELQCKKLLLATGLADYLPEVKGVEQYYGKGVHHCPYCDGWGVRDQPLVAYGLGKVAVGLSLALKTWSQDVSLCTDGTHKLPKADREKLARNGIKVFTQKINRLEGNGEQLEFIIFDDRVTIPCSGMFFSMGTYQQSFLLQDLGCVLTHRGVAKTSNKQKTNVTGLFVAGDAARDMQQVIVAAAEGTKAAIAINMELQKEAVL
jgi:thioredoxin reductase